MKEGLFGMVLDGFPGVAEQSDQDRPAGGRNTKPCSGITHRRDQTLRLSFVFLLSQPRRLQRLRACA